MSLICCRFLRYRPSYMHCCRALTLASARLSRLEYETGRCEPPPGHVFVESLAEIDPRKVAKVARRSRHKNNASATHFFALSPKPIRRFR